MFYRAAYFLLIKSFKTLPPLLRINHRYLCEQFSNRLGRKFKKEKKKKKSGEKSHNDSPLANDCSAVLQSLSVFSYSSG